MQGDGPGMFEDVCVKIEGGVFQMSVESVMILTLIPDMNSKLLPFVFIFLLCPGVWAGPSADSIAGKKTVFLGDSITQAGTYVSFASYYFQRLHPEKDFDIYPLGLASETLSGLSEEGHAGGRFPRPCLCYSRR